MKYLFITVMSIACFCSCRKSQIETFDNTRLENETISLIANHNILIADGVAELQLIPLVYESLAFKVDRIMNPAGNDQNFGKDSIFNVLYLNDRFKESEVKYFFEDGTEMEKPFFKTTATLPATRTFYAEVQGKRTNNFAVSIVPPITQQFEEVTFPVVFHLVTTRTLDSYGFGLPMENVERLINGLNSAFGRIGITSPNGANAKIKFRMAEYDINGSRMATPGIHKVFLPDASYAGIGNNVNGIPEVLWDAKKYLNIWVMKTGANTTLPAHALPGFNVPGITVTIVDESFNPNTLDPAAKGFVISEAALAKNDLDYGMMFGRFFGLLETRGTVNDYCDDTFAWVSKDVDNGRWKINSNGMRYLSVNIMDESSSKTTLSREQVLRVRAVLENCPARWAYKSNWAFTGQ